ncbi:multiple sugar transport system permease protein [Paenibacillus sp. V4I3]|uniref:carbohydrate ABC transporter permease n=1 Tax=Paenibacillus sp. V4I9 TaxID=3042308 RepID=UPI00278B9EAF|nr:carbohydrate ABC transporter permease [Paenibacillus sp. V4I9]MDQ0872446.1 multiple sugar transport system permease protein [Paenibacillus sp. V4I3]MDQ0891667.1 multiple sugar transport system permease protein [Paenibacillus sp. V4I9]
MVSYVRNVAPTVSRVITLTLFLIGALFPFYWMLVTSLKDRQEIYSGKLTLWPQNLTFSNYIDTFQNSSFPLYFMNSFIVSMSSSILVLFVSILGGYSMARYSFRGKKLFLISFLATQMIPVMVILVPLFITFSQLHLLNKLPSLIITYTAMNIPFCLLTMSSFFQRIPVSLEEAALIDGCNKFQTMTKIILPIMRPGIVATLVFAFTGAWNDLFFGVMFTNSESTKTVPVGLSSFVQKFDINWGQMSAAGILSLIPVVIMFAFAQKYIVSGLTEGAVKG